MGIALEALLAQVWTRQVQRVKDRRAPGRHPTLATLSPTGFPEARTDVLRAADHGSGQNDIHTELQPGKIVVLQACPRGAVYLRRLCTSSDPD